VSEYKGSFFKEIAEEDSKYLEFIRTEPCLFATLKPYKPTIRTRRGMVHGERVAVIGSPYVHGITLWVELQSKQAATMDRPG